MVNPERPILGEGSRNRIVDLATGLKVLPKRLLERHSHRRTGEAGGLQTIDHGLEQGRSSGEKNANSAARVANRSGKLLETRPLIDVDGHIVEARKEAFGDTGAVEALLQM